MRLPLFVFPALLASLLLAGCSAMSVGQSPSAPVEAALLQQMERATAYYNAGNLDAYKSMYTEDAIHISVRRPMVRGREAIGRFFAPGMKLFTMKSALEVIDVEQSGDTAYLLVNSELGGIPRPGVEIPEFSEKRTIMVVFRQVNGEWLIHRYIASFSPE